jgi:hypothetical protein
MCRYYGASEFINLCKGVEKFHQYFRFKMFLENKSVVV